jgi:hypothetical protein
MRVRSSVSRIAVCVAAFAALALLAGCNNNDVTGAGGALARIAVDAPDNATSGQNFDIRGTAQAIGVENVQNGIVTITLPSPLTVVNLNAEAGTTATFSGNVVTWNLGTLDANTELELTISAMGTTATQMTNLSVNAQLLGNGINAGDAVATDTLTLNP